MYIKFIVPRNHDHDNPLCQMAQSRVFPPMGLAKMAAKAASTSHVSYLDERIEASGHRVAADIAVIFINSYNRHQAYTLASLYRNSGSFVVFTGPLLEKSPEDASQHADCLFIGAGEEIMPTFLNDFARGKRRRLYGSYLNPVTVEDRSELQLAS
jgi:radical SAM superfamily enzyme YgiQ (UPF0313 family)